MYIMNIMYIMYIIYYSGPRRAFLAQKCIKGKSLHIPRKNILPRATLGYSDLELIQVLSS